LWRRLLTSTGFSRVTGVAVDVAGDVVLAGAAGSSIDFGSGPSSCGTGGGGFAAKLDPSGKTLWGRCFGDTSSFDDLVVGGSVAVSAAGEILWTGTYRGNNGFHFVNLPCASSGDPSGVDLSFLIAQGGPQTAGLFV